MINTSGHVLSARFVLVRTLGQGGAGQVWLAQDRELGGHVALKILAPELAGDARLVNALERECTRARTLAHPHILRVEGFYREADQVWIVMEYLAGGDLTQLRGRPGAEVLKAAIPVAEALAYAHAAGVVHRDVKAANVLLGLDGSPRLADFGIALALAESPDSQQSRGSPYSMSPQQASGAPAQPADDAYAFGVLLYELLSGYPPFYPDIDADKRANDPPPPLVARYPTPEAVVALIGRCLEKDPALRPDMKSIAQELGGALAAEARAATGPRTGIPPVLRPPSAVEAPLQAGWQRSAPATAPTPQELRSEGFRRGLTAAALLLLLAAAGVVFFVLPDRMAAPPRVVATVPAGAPAAAQDKTPLDLEALAVQKQQADDLLAAVTPRVAELKDRGAEQWAAKEWTALQAGLATAEESYAARDYVAAVGNYESAAKPLDSLEARAAEVLKDALAQGMAALEGGNAAAAQETFGLALKLSPGQAEATRGLRRAQSLDAVMALVSQAETAENEGKISQAADAFGRALKLDPDLRRASVGLARVQSRAAGDAFATVMARGFAALSSKDYAAAKKAFESARSMRPQAAEVQQALQQTEQEERTATIAVKLASAGTHEQAERWQQALADYQAVLQLDATMVAAQQGIERTSPRAALNDELQLYVTQPERLFSAPVRDTARATLARARTVSPGPVLEKQIATLDDWLRRATIPVQVALESDNLTRVTIYRVGDMGAFTSRAVELTPGRYTVVGTRPGYRDVRREIMVAPGEAQSVVIRCEDRI